MSAIDLRVFAVCGIAALATASAVQAGDVYRCIDGGQVEYTDRPCGDAVPLMIDANRAGIVLARAQPPGIVLAQARIGENAVPASATPVMAGMTPKLVYETMGRPREMNVRIEGITPVERWSYRTAEGSVTVTFRHGRVASVATQ